MWDSFPSPARQKQGVPLPRLGIAASARSPAPARQLRTPLSPGPCSLPRRWQRPSLHEKIHSMDGLFAPGTKLPPQCSQPCLRYEVCISNMFVGQVTISVRIITYHHHFKWLHTPFFSLGKSSFLKCRASPKTLNGPWSSLLLNGWAKKTILTQFYGDITH